MNNKLTPFAALDQSVNMMGKQAGRGDQAMKMIKAITTRATNGVGAARQPASDMLTDLSNNMRSAAGANHFSFGDDVGNSSLIRSALGKIKNPKNPMMAATAKLRADDIAKALRNWRSQGV